MVCDCESVTLCVPVCFKKMQYKRDTELQGEFCLDLCITLTGISTMTASVPLSGKGVKTSFTSSHGCNRLNWRIHFSQGRVDADEVMSLLHLLK